MLFSKMELLRQKGLVMKGGWKQTFRFLQLSRLSPDFLNREFKTGATMKYAG